MHWYQKCFQINSANSRELFTLCQLTKTFTEFSAFLREWYWSLSQISKSWRRSRFSWKAFITPRLPSHTINFNLLVSDGKQVYSLLKSPRWLCYTALIESHCSYTGNTVTITYSASTMNHTPFQALYIHTCIHEKTGQVLSTDHSRLMADRF